MIYRLSDNQFLNFGDIYLVDYDDFSNELMIYINQHVKHAIVIKDKESIESFKMAFNEYVERNKPIYETNKF